MGKLETGLLLIIQETESNEAKEKKGDSLDTVV